MSLTKLLVNGKVVMCMHEGERTSLWTSAKIKLLWKELDDSCVLHNQLFSEPATVCQGKRVMFHFRCSYLNVNKVSKTETTRKIEYADNFWKCANAVFAKLSKSVHAWRNYRLPKLARFLRLSVDRQGHLVHAIMFLTESSRVHITRPRDPWRTSSAIWWMLMKQVPHWAFRLGLAGHTRSTQVLNVHTETQVPYSLNHFVWFAAVMISCL